MAIVSVIASLATAPPAAPAYSSNSAPSNFNASGWTVTTQQAHATSNQGMSTQTMLLLGAGAVVFLLVSKK